MLLGENWKKICRKEMQEEIFANRMKGRREGQKEGQEVLLKKAVLHFGVASLFVFSLMPTIVLAQSKDKPLEVAINYIGTLDEQPLFQVDFDNRTGAPYRIFIKDENGEVLYSERVSGKSFSKKFKLESSELNNSRLSFIVTSSKQKYTQVFEINQNVRSVQDYVITRL